MNIDGVIYIYGGRNDAEQYRDLWALHLGVSSLVNICLRYIAAHYERYKSELTQLPVHLQAKFAPMLDNDNMQPPSSSSSSSSVLAEAVASHPSSNLDSITSTPAPPPAAQQDPLTAFLFAQLRRADHHGGQGQQQQQQGESNSEPGPQSQSFG